jgi:hypothetical protein
MQKLLLALAPFLACSAAASWGFLVAAMPMAPAARRLDLSIFRETTAERAARAARVARRRALCTHAPWAEELVVPR